MISCGVPPAGEGGNAMLIASDGCPRWIEGSWKYAEGCRTGSKEGWRDKKRDSFKWVVYGTGKALLSRYFFIELVSHGVELLDSFLNYSSPFPSTASITSASTHSSPQLTLHRQLTHSLAITPLLPLTTPILKSTTSGLSSHQ